MRTTQLIEALQTVIYRDVPEGTTLMHQDIGGGYQEADLGSGAVAKLALAREIFLQVRAIVEEVVPGDEVQHDHAPSIQSGITAYFNSERAKLPSLAEQLHRNGLPVDLHAMQRSCDDELRAILSVLPPIIPAR